MHLTHVTTAYCSEKPKLATRYSVYKSQVHTPIFIFEDLIVFVSIILI